MASERFTGVHWITGASSGIGRALALALARAGASVAATARRAAALESLAQDAADASGRIRAYPADVTDGEAMAQTVAAIEHDLGPIRRAVLNAGIYGRQRSRDFAAAGYRKVFAVNVVGVANGIEALLPRMRGRGGEIWLMGSLSAYRGLPEAAPYGASKAALLSMAESLAPFLARHDVRLHIISPGFVRTPMTAGNRFPMPLLMDADKAAAIILRGLRGKRFEIAFPTRLAWTMKLARCLPAAWWFALERLAITAGRNKK